MKFGPKMQLPGDMDRDTLIDLHNEIIAQSYHIRINSRWGDFTEYSVRINSNRARIISGVETIPEHVTCRLCFGVDRASDQLLDDTIDVQIHDKETLEWTTILYDPGTDQYTADADHVIREASAYLDRKHPLAPQLLEIDRRLLTVLN